MVKGMNSNFLMAAVWGSIYKVSVEMHGGFPAELAEELPQMEQKGSCGTIFPQMARICAEVPAEQFPPTGYFGQMTQKGLLRGEGIIDIACRKVPAEPGSADL